MSATPVRPARASFAAPARGTDAVTAGLPALALTAFLCAVTPLALTNGGEAPQRVADGGTFALCVAAGAVYALRRRRPLTTYAVAVGCTVVFVLREDGGGPIFVAALLAMLGVVARRPRPEWLAAVAAGAALLAGAQVAVVGLSPEVLVVVLIWFGVALAWGEIVRLRAAQLREAHARAEQAERRREEEALRRAAEERLHLAREVHDVVGHGLATIALQAGVAEHLLDRRPEEARKAVTAIRALSTRALDELRAELTALREGPEPRRPTPGLDALPALVASMREAGLPVDLAVADDPGRPPPEAVQAAAYRIVREALTNVARHAGEGAHARVRVALDDGGGLQVEVVDDGAGGPSAPDGLGPTGSGLAGMRERAAALGGAFEAGCAPDGGFRVWAALPGVLRG